HYAEGGFPVLPSITRTIEAVTDLFTEAWTPSARVWLSGGRAPVPGSTWRSPTIAETYRRILAAASGPSRAARIAAARRSWYAGFVAEEIDGFCRTAWRDTSGRDHPGLLVADDLARWQPSVEAPAAVELRGGFTVAKTGAGGEGPVLLQQLRVL